MRADRCPVCRGSGKKGCAPVVTDNIYTKNIYRGTEVDCHGCAGRGWVEVHEDEGKHCPRDYSQWPPPDWDNGGLTTTWQPGKYTIWSSS